LCSICDKDPILKPKAEGSPSVTPVELLTQERAERSGADRRRCGILTEDGPGKTRKYPGFKSRGKQQGVLLAGYPFRHWSVASSRTVLANRVLKVRQDTCVIPASEGALKYFVLELADWVNVVPVTSAGELVMVRQYRHATRGVTLEILAGSVKENEVPADAARRELLKERDTRP
jgi:hypothetical protein